MSQKIDSKEVLSYLNELGYTNISAQQLKEFIIDLKKIMKYEYRRRKHLVQSGCSNTFGLSCNYTGNTDAYIKNNTKRQKSPPRSSNDIFETLYNLPTEAFKGKIVKRNNQPIAIHIKQAKKKNPEHDHCIHVDYFKEESTLTSTPNESDKNMIEPKRTTESTESDRNKIKSDSSKTELEAGSSRTSGLRPNSKESQRSSAQSTNFRKSKTQVLLPSNSTKTINKSDPVALYHEYQKQWKTIKFPGQDNHLDLRWAIREKLINGPVVEVIKKPSVKKIAFI